MLYITEYILIYEEKQGLWVALDDVGWVTGGLVFLYVVSLQLCFQLHSR